MGRSGNRGQPRQGGAGTLTNTGEAQPRRGSHSTANEDVDHDDRFCPTTTLTKRRQHPGSPPPFSVGSLSAESRRANEQYVDDITLSWLYETRSATMLVFGFVALAFYAFREPDESLSHQAQREHNVWVGVVAVAACFLMLSALVMPNGPFVRPHPLVWRLVLGGFTLYWMGAAFMLFQSREDVLYYLQYLEPETLAGEQSLNQNDMAIDPNSMCDFTFANLMSRVDIFCVAHFLGWVVKSLLLRSVFLSWLCSIMWELTEIIFVGLLPNFAECWWDALLFDVLICNGLGILVGTRLCTYFEGKTYSWVGIRQIRGLRGKAKRAFLQFTPASWTTVVWDPLQNYKRYFGVCVLLLSVMICELNCFFLKGIFFVPTNHRFNIYRLGVWSAVGMPALRQVYIYMADPHCKRLGTHAFVATGCLFTESLVVFKHSVQSHMFKREDVIDCLLRWTCTMVSCTAVATFGYRAYKKRLHRLRAEAGSRK